MPLAAARKSLLRGCFVWLVSTPAIAQTSASTATDGELPFGVEVERDELSDSCPDLPWFRARIKAHTGDAEHPGSFKISFTRRGEAWHAKIQRWEQRGNSPAAERTLQDRGPSCEPLAEAVALTIAILVDDYARSESKAAAPRDSVPRDELPPRSSSPPPAAEVYGGTKIWIGTGGGAAMSFISPIAPLLGFSVAFDSLNLRHGLRLMLTPEQKFELDPGRVVVQAWLVTVFSCLRFSQGSLDAALCAAIDGSMLRASAEGFEDGKSSTRGYAAAGLEAQPGWTVTDGYRISAAFAALVPFNRESFSVTGRGVAYVPPELNWRILLFSEIGAF